MLRKIIQHLEIRQKDNCMFSRSYGTLSNRHPPKLLILSRGSGLLFDLLLTPDLGSGSVKWDALLGWSLQMLFVK